MNLKNKSLSPRLLSLIILVFQIQSVFGQAEAFKTEILKWPDGKKAAISMTYDDGTYNQFHVALPIMEELGMKGTFYINTGEIPSSKTHAQFFGRDPKVIIAETASIPTNAKNIFERASLIRFLDMPGAVSYHDRSGATYEQGRLEQAFKILDEGFAKARELKVTELVYPKIIDGPMIDWEEIRKYAQNGHEFGVHTISHPRLAVLDEKNLLFELEACRDEIEKELGKEQLFSAECPFGTEDERVMEYALEMFPALRNRMPEAYLEEINRSGKIDAAQDYGKEYIQWQRGPLSKTTPEHMNSWVDEILTREDTWLVLVFHGIEGIGWEAIPEDRIRAYFEYIASKSKEVWVAPFRDVTQYMRQRMNTNMTKTVSKDMITLTLGSVLDPYWYRQKLTLKTYIPAGWKSVNFLQGGKTETLEVQKDAEGSFVQYNADPHGGELTLKNVGQ
ncbi:polysaccharide deacetylase family protein [Aquiflexum sp. TKW24L]|uniref:polysaccharide deacetylase family protein n=1 Tax=Aquiflexum sp. TKW24L TaxID=2942212 RepID=UPI0020C00EBF|nr:polysaccharide deacetylase family protein [Aquiflexum sp. TKW24L]MCL6261425.1 polysaccharide deacetylase family protein [Aquiflexum sp. TKW24L]